jgi:hypothetical protein
MLLKGAFISNGRIAVATRVMLQLVMVSIARMKGGLQSALVLSCNRAVLIPGVLNMFYRQQASTGSM